MIARAYTTALNAASGGSGVENTEYNRWTNCRGNRRVNALFPRYRYISLLVFIIPRLLQHGEYANSLEFVKIFFNYYDDTSNLEIIRHFQFFSLLRLTSCLFFLSFFFSRQIYDAINNSWLISRYNTAFVDTYLSLCVIRVEDTRTADNSLVFLALKARGGNFYRKM